QFLIDVLGPHVEWVPVCPEVEMGLGTPRETLHLVDDRGRARLVTTRTGIDHTAAMSSWAGGRRRSLAGDDLDRHGLKRKSPRRGLAGIKVVGRSGDHVRTGSGLYASALVEFEPLLPVEEEGRLSDPVRRENFIERLFAYRRLKALFKSRWTQSSLI